MGRRTGSEIEGEKEGEMRKKPWQERERVKGYQ